MSDKLDANDIPEDEFEETLARVEAEADADARAEAETTTANIEDGSTFIPAEPLGTLLDDPEVLNPPPRIRSTFNALDQLLNGGFMPAASYVLAGLTGRGKTTLALNLARRIAASGTPTLLVSLEDDRASTIRKLWAAESKVKVRTLERFKDAGAEDRALAEAVRQRLVALPLRVDTQNAGLAELCSLIRFEAASGTRFVILDQTSWVRVERKDAFEEASEISRTLAVLARELKIVIVLLVQVNRMGAAAKSENKPLELYHLRDSGRLEQDAGGVLIVQRFDAETGKMRLDVKKHRGGPRDQTITMNVTPEYALVDDDPDCLGPISCEQLDAAAEAEAKKDEWTAERFAKAFLTSDWLKWDAIETATKGKISGKETKRLLSCAVTAELCERRGGTGRRPFEYRLCVCAHPPYPPIRRDNAPMGGDGTSACEHTTAKATATPRATASGLKARISKNAASVVQTA